MSIGSAAVAARRVRLFPEARGRSVGASALGGPEKTGHGHARRTRRTGILTLVLALTTSGCDTVPELPADARVRYDTVGGVPHVISGNRGAWAGGGSWTVPDSGVVIGALEGPEEQVFGEVAGVVVDGEGRIWVADDQAKEIRVFDADGAFVRTIGRDGEGPGEFRNLSGLAVAPEGVGALDGTLARVTVFRPSGEVVRTFSLDRPYMILEHGATMAFDDHGRFFDRARFATRPLLDSMAVITYSPAGEPVDTAFIAAIEQDHLVVERGGRPIMTFPRPYGPSPSLAIGPDGTIYFTRGDAYRIQVLDPSGDTVRVLRREIQPRPLTEEEREAALDDIAERYEQAGAIAPPRIDIPEIRPVIARLAADPAGNLWVLNPPEPSWRSFEWWVHDPEGRYLGAVAAPTMNVMHIGEELMAGVTWDELGVQRVKVVPIRK